LFEFADAGVWALPNGEGLDIEAFAESGDDGGADVVLGGGLGEELEENEVVVAVGEDAGEVVGFGEDEAVGVVGGGDWGEFSAELEGGGDAEAEVVEILLAGEIGRGGDEAGGDLRGGGVDGCAEGFAGGGEGDESAGGGVGVLMGFEVGAVDPEVAGEEAVGGAAGDAEGGHAGLSVAGSGPGVVSCRGRAGLEEE